MNSKSSMEGLRSRPDFLLLFVVLSLVGFGLAMVFSASSAIAANNPDYGNNPYFFFIRQAIMIFVGLILMFFIMLLQYEKVKQLYPLIIAGSLIMLVLVLIIGEERNGAQSWFQIAGFGIQPTEFAKVAIVLYLAVITTKKQDKLKEFKAGLRPILFILAAYFGLIMLQPDLGATIVLGLTAFIILFIAGARVSHLLLLLIVVLAAGYFGYQQLDEDSYKLDRLTAFTKADTACASPACYHIQSSLQAFGHGGIFGTGYGEGIQKVVYLPYGYSDFIYAVIGEELGFIGSLTLLLVFIILIWRGIVIAGRCPDNFGRIAGFGIIVLLAVQTFVNIGGVISLIPVTGLTLPFISHGGSSIISTLMMMGILLNISRYQVRS